MPGRVKRNAAQPKDHVRLPRGYRFILPRDAALAFATGNQRMDDWTLAEYVGAHHQPDAMVVARPLGARLAGVVLVLVRGNHLFIERLARDADGLKGTGAALMAVVEDHIAPQLGCAEIWLEAMGDGLRRFYRALGYVETGRGEEDPYWGWLIPMKKHVA